MSLTALALIVVIILTLGYTLYGRLIARQYALDDKISTPAVQINDGVVTLTGLGPDRTELTVRESGYASPDLAEMSRGGMEQCLEKMAALLERDRSAG